MKIDSFARLRVPDTRTDVLELGKKRRNLHLLGKQISIRRVGRSGRTTGPFQARFYVCNESDKKVIAGPFRRLTFADECVENLYRSFQLELPFAPDVRDA